MGLHNFSMDEQFSTIDKVPDFRTEEEKRFTPLSIYNHDKADIGYAERMAEELINVSGSWVMLFRRLPKSEISEDEVWDEDADPIYADGMRLKAHVKPELIRVELTRFGVDIPLKATITFSRAVLLEEIGERLLIPGDIIEVPYNIPSFQRAEPSKAFKSSTRFRILNSFPTGNFMYRWLYQAATSELVTGDKALRVVHK